MILTRHAVFGCCRPFYINLFFCIFCCALFICCHTKPEEYKTAIKQPSTLETNLSLVNSALNYLQQEMDIFHDRTIVFDDFESGGERFYPSGWMKGPNEEWPDVNDGRLQFSFPADEAHQGSSCLQINWSPPGEDQWVAVAWKYPEINEGDSEGYNLQGADCVSFWAKGETGREIITFKFGAKYTDSSGEIESDPVRLSRKWKQYTIGLSGNDLSSIITGFCFAISKKENPNGCIFYLDDISINYSWLEDARLIRSYHVGSEQLPKNRHLRNTCYVYDNALAVCAFLSSTSPELHARACLIADAFVLLCDAEGNGSLKNAYANGELFKSLQNDKQPQIPRTPGYMRCNKNHTCEWIEDKYSKGIDCGNMAWAMLALLNVWQNNGQNPNSKYIRSVQKMGNWILANTTDKNHGAYGFYGGKEWDCENERYEPVSWKSTEHNIDLAVVFARLAETVKDENERHKWLDASKNAYEFVRWAKIHGKNDGGRLVTGIVEGTDKPRFSPKPLDPQTWSVLAFPSDSHEYEPALNWAMQHCQVKINSIYGYQFSAGECNSIWPEGTAQVALALRFLGRNDDAEKVLKQLELILKASKIPGAMTAAYPEFVDTGFGWGYHTFPHLGATSWYILASNSWNPYSGSKYCLLR